MRKALACLIILLSLPALLFAQDDDGPDVETDWDHITAETYVRGDQSFIISLGVSFPVLFLDHEGNQYNHNITPPVGGTGSLVYSYHLNQYLFVGGEIGLLFLPTLSRDTIFIIPLGVRIGTQLMFGRFEFPIFASIGMVWHRFLNQGYYGMYVRAGFSAFFKATMDWSFGLTTSWSWFPQWTSDPAKNRDGNFMDLTISARYHF